MNQLPSLESICEALYGVEVPSVDDSNTSADTSDGAEVDPSLLAAILADDAELLSQTIELARRKVNADRAVIPFSAEKAEQGDVVAIYRLPGDAEPASPIVVVLDMPTSSDRKMWHVWHTSSHYGYGTAFDMLLDDRPNINPALGMVMSWSKSRVLADSMAEVLLKLSLSDVAAIRALEDEFLAQPEIEASASEMRAIGMRRKTLGGILVRTGLPLRDLSDERTGFAQLYSRFSADLTECFEAATVSSEEPWFAQKFDQARAFLKQGAKRWVGSSGSPTSATTSLPASAISLRGGARSTLSSLSLVTRSSAPGSIDSGPGTTEQSRFQASWICDDIQFGLREWNGAVLLTANPSNILKEATSMQWFDEVFQLQSVEGTDDRLLSGLTPIIADILLQRAEGEDSLDEEAIPWLIR